MAQDWTHFDAISKSAADIAAGQGLLGRRRGKWVLWSQSQAARLGIIKQDNMDIYFCTEGEVIREKYTYGPLVCDRGEIANDAYLHLILK